MVSVTHGSLKDFSYFHLEKDFPMQQYFPQVLRTWRGVVQNLMGGAWINTCGNMGEDNHILMYKLLN